jgi:uncharacterized protein (UPF0332 family)
MTSLKEENKRKNIREEMEKAGETINAATLLFDNGFFNDAISRLYYCVLHNVRALLLTEGLEPKSHEGALRLLSLHFVKEGIFEPRVSHTFSKLMKYREEADYNPSYVFTAEDFVDFKREAEDLSNRIRAFLRSKNYL